MVSGSATLTTTATSTSPIGSYPITFSTQALTATNYSFTYVAGTLTVIQAPTVAIPSISPTGGTFTSAQTVMLSDASPGAAIYYSTDGSIPGPKSTIYKTSLLVSASETVNAIAILNGISSQVATAVFTIKPAQCQTINYSKGFSAAGLSLNGSAKISGNLLQLTDGGVTEAGSAYFATPVSTTSFVTDFTFQLVNPEADGITFVIQATGPNALGGSGGGLGYGGIPKSIALKFDLHDNSGEGQNSVGTYIDGASPTVPAVTLDGTGLDLHSGDIFELHFAYTEQQSTVTFTDLATGKVLSTKSQDKTKRIDNPR